jgi:hypothetical protein
MLDEGKMEIKIGDMIQSDTGACGIVISLPDTSKHRHEYIINWNRGEPKEWGVAADNIAFLIKYGKWKVLPV